eukprot:Skav217806  [mRNA]  locus=scaffold1782:589936:610591:- [translate_table: standard]
MEHLIGVYVGVDLLEGVAPSIVNYDDVDMKKREWVREPEDEAVRNLQRTLQGAVKRLSEDLYSGEAHFLLELLQNVDDCQYPEGCFAQSPSSVTVNTKRGGKSVSVVPKSPIPEEVSRHRQLFVGYLRGSEDIEVLQLLLLIVAITALKKPESELTADVRNLQIIPTEGGKLVSLTAEEDAGFKVYDVPPDMAGIEALLGEEPTEEKLVLADGGAAGCKAIQAQTLWTTAVLFPSAAAARWVAEPAEGFM